jgi:hypothetical protein
MEGVLIVSKKARPAVEEIKYLFMSHERNTGQYHNISCYILSRMWKNSNIPYFLAHKTYRPIRCTVNFSLEILEKNDDECISVLVIYWKKTGLLHTKFSNHNIIYSSQKPRKLLSLPLKSSSWLFSLDAFKFGNKTQVKFRSHFLGGKSVSYGPGNTVYEHTQTEWESILWGTYLHVIEFVYDSRPSCKNS